MRLGFHLSIGGGFLNVVAQGLRTNCECAQIFSRNPRGWAVKPLDPKEADSFHRARMAAGLWPLAVHLPYLPNLATANEELWDRSTKSLIEEINRAELLRADFVIFHPGHAAREQSRDDALERIARGVTTALNQTEPGSLILLLETTSGQRGEIGSTFEELSMLLANIEAKRPRAPLGICMDTAHVWAAGYDLAGKPALDRTLRALELSIGLNRLKLIHFNDSWVDRGSRRDRHAPVGLGRIGPENMARILGHPILTDLAAIMETPRQSEADDLINMTRARLWRQAGSTGRDAGIAPIP